MRTSITVAVAAIAALVAHLAQAEGAAAFTAPVDPLQACVACHRAGTDPAAAAVPHLDGQIRSYLIESIELLRDRRRATRIENHVPVEWGSAQVTSAAIHFSTAGGRPPLDPVDPALAAQGREIFRERCETCHASDGQDTDPRGAGSPILAGQRLAYLKSQMLAYLKGERPYLVDMKKRSFRGLPLVLRGAIVSEPGTTMTDADAEVIAHFLASVPRTISSARQSRLR